MNQSHRLMKTFVLPIISIHQKRRQQKSLVIQTLVEPQPLITTIIHIVEVEVQLIVNQNNSTHPIVNCHQEEPQNDYFVEG